MIDAASILKDFPQLRRKINGKRIVYLDSTATSLKPAAVIAKESEYYQKYCANIFRGIYTISEEATAAYERVRELVAKFINAPSAAEVIFTRNTTESINLIAYGLTRGFLNDGDQIVSTIMEHHSNFVPWQQLGLERGYVTKIWNCDQSGKLNLTDLDRLVTKKTKVVTFTAVSNVLGTMNPVANIVRAVKKLNPQCLVLVDAAQAAPHMKIDVKAWGADFVAFSSHKMVGPTGIGVLWGKAASLEMVPPFLYGGEMISEVRLEKTLFKDVPHRFEAGTPDIAGVIGLGAAVEYLSQIGMDQIRQHEIAINRYAMEKLSRIAGLTIYGPKQAEERGGVMAFTITGIHPHDIAQVLNEDNICIRSGSHCAMPLHTFLGLGATARASYYIYTTEGDIDALVAGLVKVQKLFR